MLIFSCLSWRSYCPREARYRWKREREMRERNDNELIDVYKHGGEASSTWHSVYSLRSLCLSTSLFLSLFLSCSPWTFFFSSLSIFSLSSTRESVLEEEEEEKKNCLLRAGIHQPFGRQLNVRGFPPSSSLLTPLYKSCTQTNKERKKSLKTSTVNEENAEWERKDELKKRRDRRCM